MRPSETTYESVARILRDSEASRRRGQHHEETVRDELTGEWKNRGVQEHKEFAILTAEISKATFDPEMWLSTPEVVGKYSLKRRVSI